jgi:hypothetical protein
MDYITKEDPSPLATWVSFIISHEVEQLVVIPLQFVVIIVNFNLEVLV